MRLVKRGMEEVLLNDQRVMARIRPIRGQLEQQRYGEYVQDMLRLLLPFNAVASPGQTVVVDGKPYVCLNVRRMAGHIQLDVRRRHL